MPSDTLTGNINKSYSYRHWYLVGSLLAINFLLRIIIYYSANIFYFSDYSAYLDGIENIANGGKQYLLTGNFLYTISFIGYFSKYILGSINYFFFFNCLLGTLSSMIIYILVVKITRLKLAGIITIIIHTLYTEFMVFSSVFYTPVIMIFLLTLFLLFIYYYLYTLQMIHSIIYLFLLVIVFLLTFFFKPELKYLPWCLIFTGLIFIKKNKSFSRKILLFSFILLPLYYLLNYSGLITQPEGNVISNSFVFFGHTDYGGDGGEGAFIYPQNKARYDEALSEYAVKKKISEPTEKDYNSFQRSEIIKYITNHPVKWVELQFTKFFRTFGIVPESTSFKVLYTGLIKEKLWLTAIVVVSPVAIIILLFILFFNFNSIKQLHKTSTLQPFNTSSLHSENKNSGFLYIYLLLFIYYIVATIFYGHYQERYRMPLMVIFISPVLGYFLATFNREQLRKKSFLIIKCGVIVLFLATWGFQSKKAIRNKYRYENAIEPLKVQIENNINQVVTMI